MNQTPLALSVVLATPSDYEAIRKTITHLHAQTVVGSLELLIVTPSITQLCMENEEHDAFAQVQIVEIGPIASIGVANAEGIRRAKAPIVVLAEDHCFPESGWAAVLLQAHEDDWAAVGPGICNANPGTAVSWADFLIGYGPWLLPNPGGEVDFLPGHNTSYKRDELLVYGDRLNGMMEAETVLHWDLRMRGRRLLMEPHAVTAHTNFSLWRSLLAVQFFNGRLFAGSRVRTMPRWKRLVYILGSPLIPLVRLMRIAGQSRRCGYSGQFFGCLHALVIGLTLDGAGQLAGYLCGIGNARKKVAEYEFRRIDHITESDRRLIYGKATLE